jgi:2Fe-2S ferredoxin
MSVHFQWKNKTTELPCLRGLNLLGHAQLEELEIGSRCGGHGICGGDRIQLVPGYTQVSAPNEIERQHLSPQEIQDGWRLACQTWPTQDGDDLWVTVP